MGGGFGSITRMDFRKTKIGMLKKLWAELPHELGPFGQAFYFFTYLFVFLGEGE